MCLEEHFTLYAFELKYIPYFSFLLPSHLRELLSGDEVADVDELELLRLGGAVQLDREALVDAAEDLYSIYRSV